LESVGNGFSVAIVNRLVGWLERGEREREVEEGREAEGGLA
jgi:hypothetical protein